MTRAVSPVVGTVTLVLIAVLLAGVLMASVGTASLDQTDPEFASISATATQNGTIVLTHEGGQPVDVREISVVISVEGTRLAEQPPVPFFSAAGFEPGPTGPFNSAAEPRWTVGETTSLTIAGSNTPTPEPGDSVTVEILRGDRPLTRVQTTIPRDASD